MPAPEGGGTAVDTIPQDDRRAAVVAALDTVLDPELDEPVTTMGFIEAIDLGEASVEITFRLPTFWCSANFAFLMASDMRCAVEQLPFIETASVRLVDHFAAGKINRGVEAGLGFAAIFSGEAETDLDEIRQAFRERAFLGRQDRLLELLAARIGVDATLAMTVADLVACSRHEEADVRGAATRYFAMRRHEGAASAEAPAFVTLAGVAVAPAGYAAHRRMIRSVRAAAAANAELCRIYLAARRSHPVPGCGPEHRQDGGDDD
ncbi:MAG TPA: iron-sulfur cluster assembly protein [Lichenihabitans sp.]|jgi:metal-sulfur cluster biosynthetic enzyme|nr:iron-sulfur cluster assembly protein [Lichenihabitans sp.]